MSLREPLTARAVIDALRPEAVEQPDVGPDLRLAALLLVYGVALTVLTLTQPFSEFTFLAISDVAGVVPPIAAGALALFAAQRSALQVRLAWRFIGVGCLLWGLGESIWTVYEVVLRDEVPFPSFADVGYLAMLPLMALGLTFLSSQRRQLAHVLPTLDGIALVLAFSAIVWFFVLRPTYEESAASVLEKAIGGAYPVGDLVLAYVLVVAVRRQWGFREGVVLMLLLAGLLLLIAADVGFAYLTLADAYSSSSPVNLGWPYGFLLMAYAAALSARWSLSYAEDAGPSAISHAAGQVLPLALFVPTLPLIFVAFRDESLTASIPLASMAGIAVLAVMGRLAIDLGLVQELEDSRQRLLFWLDDRQDRWAA